MDLQDQPGLPPVSASARWQRTIATLMMSAAVPWITVLTASRSPSRRVLGLPERSSGIGRRRPISVVTKPSSWAFSTISSRKARTAGKRSR